MAPIIRVGLLLFGVLRYANAQLPSSRPQASPKIRGTVEALLDDFLKQLSVSVIAFLWDVLLRYRIGL